jgi:hypothetical protein
LRFWSRGDTAEVLAFGVLGRSFAATRLFLCESFFSISTLVSDRIRTFAPTLLLELSGPLRSESCSICPTRRVLARPAVCCLRKFLMLPLNCCCRRRARGPTRGSSFEIPGGPFPGGPLGLGGGCGRGDMATKGGTVWPPVRLRLLSHKQEVKACARWRFMPMKSTGRRPSRQSKGRVDSPN